MDQAHKQNTLNLPPISPASHKTYYEQIVEGIKGEVGSGRLAPHTPLPSFRALAVDLLVSVITVRRAYEELEREGVIYRRQGLGTFVAEHGAARSRAIKSLRAEQLIEEAVREFREAGLETDEILRIIRRRLSAPGAAKQDEEA